MKFRNALIISSAGHLVPLLALIVLTTFGTTNTGTGDSENTENTGPVETRAITEKELGELNNKYKDGCPKYFVGIGITVTSTSREVIEVHRGYSAEKYGIQLGDIILNFEDISKGPLGSMVTVQLLRGQRLINIPVERDRICLE